MRRLVISLLLMAFTGMMSTAVWFLFHSDNWAALKAKPLGQKQYSCLIAEEVRIRDYKTFGVDVIAFKSSHVEKRRRGPITFGSFNVLVLDELVLNLPSGAADEADDTDRTLRKGDFAKELPPLLGLNAARFSGIRINGLTVNRCFSNRVEHVFSAGWAEGGIGQPVSLRECVITSESGDKEMVHKARLELKPGLALVYSHKGVDRRIKIPCYASILR